MRARLRVGLVAALAVALGMGLGPGGAASATANPPDSFTFSGRGFGHGRGMGQWGALGYAVDHGWSAEQILAHYYRPASLHHNGGNPQVLVELEAHNARSVRVQAPGIRVNGQAAGQSTVRLTRNPANNQIRVEAGSSCAGPWNQIHSLSGDVRLDPAPSASALGDLLMVCDPASTANTGILYRGTLVGRVRSNQQFLLNDLPMQTYLRAVLPREMPASWGDRGGGRGMQALRAQAVAARSFAMSTGQQRTSGATTCDTIMCQVYGGAGLRGASGAITAREDHRTNSAIDTTPGWVLRQPNGTVARTEFSASTGGWSAGGVFNAVVDAGDAIVDNPNHSWTTTLTNRQIQDALGVGPVTSIEVTRRNGLGADGGRVTEMVVRSGNSARTLTGQQFRMAVGSTVLRSDWFVLGNATPPPPPVAPEVFVFGTLRAGHADTSFRFGRATDEFLAGNWWGDGDRLAVRRGNQFHFRRSLAAGPADLVVSFGRPYDDLFVGDWNGDGRDTLAVRRGNTFFVSNSLHSTTAETSFAFGRPGDEVIVGDWDGNGSDTFAVRRGNQIFLMNTLRGGTADQTFTFGRPGDALLAGNFNGRGGDTFAVRRGITMFVNNDLRGGVADHTFDLGRGGDSVLVGDWNNNGWDTFALVRR